MLAYLRDMEGKEVSAMLEERVQEVRDIAYDIEDALDEFLLHVQYQFHPSKLVRGASRLSYTHWRQCGNISSKMDDIKQKIDNSKYLDSFEPSSSSRTNLSEEGSSSGSRSVHEVMHDLDDEEIVGFQNPLEELGHHLVYGDPRRVTISVVGSAGSGKMVLVKNVYKIV